VEADEFGDLIEMGIVDATRVVYCVLQCVRDVVPQALAVEYPVLSAQEAEAEKRDSEKMSHLRVANGSGEGHF